MNPAGLSSTDRFLPVWIGLAMGIGLGRWINSIFQIVADLTLPGGSA